MWRLAALALLLCAGCASPDGSDLVADSLLGDVRSLLSGGQPSAASMANPSMTLPTVSSASSGAAGVTGSGR
jgi:hypothetical protein